MNTLDTVEKRIKLLASLRVFALNRQVESYWTHATFHLHHFQRDFEGVKIICESLGITPDIKAFFGNEDDWERLVSGFYDVLISKDKLRKLIRETFGGKCSFIFTLTQLLPLIRITSSILMRVRMSSVPKKRLPFIREECDVGYVIIDAARIFLENPSNYKGIIKLWGPDFGKLIKGLCKTIKNKKRTATWAKKVNKATEEIVNDLIPEYGEIQERIEKAERLIEDLKRCNTGTRHWRIYEDTCAKILRFLFIPPFMQIRLQARSNCNYERRDAILPNNQFSGFWHLIRNEFNSRHIICEFKNSKSGGAKDWLNQLRIYLSKPTIGKFGILFIRNTPSNSLFQAQRDAYEQAGILILLIDDIKLKELIKYKCYLNSPEIYLENEKIKFEVEY